MVEGVRKESSVQVEVLTDMLTEHTSEDLERVIATWAVSSY